MSPRFWLQKTWFLKDGPDFGSLNLMTLEAKMSRQRGLSVGHPVSVGFGGAVAGDRIVALANPGSAPIQRAARRAREEGRLIDLTYGRRIRTVLFMDSGHVIRTAVSPETLLGRWSEVKGVKVRRETSASQMETVETAEADRAS
jgi:regulator of extracellular matrix RemA (YlzA/DUF370 family)